jgi:RES domain-containing protein
MKAWRLSAKKYEATAFSGIGAARNPGRWNMHDDHVVYCSEHLAVAMMERLVYILEEPNKPYVSIEVEFPEALISTLEETELPNNWRDYPHPENVQVIGHAWVVSQASAVLRVPSVVVPGAFNYVLNVDHEAFRKISWGKAQSLKYDQRIDTLVKLATK